MTTTKHSNPYRDYLLSKYRYDDALEIDDAFLLYRISGDEFIIGEIFVPPGRRLSGLATRLADRATEIATESGCKYLVCQTQITGRDDELSMLAILHYGFKPKRAEQNMILYAKEL